MKLLFENWRGYVNEIKSAALQRQIDLDAKKRGVASAPEKSIGSALDRFKGAGVKFPKGGVFVKSPKFSWESELVEEDSDPDSNADDAAELRDVADDLESSDGSPDMQELVEEHDLDYEGEPIGFFLSLVREAPGAFMEQREQDLAEEMRQAVAKILSDASGGTEPELSPEEEAWAETYDFFGKERPPR